MGFERGTSNDSDRKSVALFGLSLGIVAFGQPAWSPLLGLLAACLGYALFWEVLSSVTAPKRRFWIACIWYTFVQMIQLSWSLTHPYAQMVVVVWAIVSFVWGVQFGLLSIVLTKDRLAHLPFLLGCAGAWTLFEWSRFFVFSGVSWNPAGLALTGSIYPLQMASVWGIFGLSFWVIFVNLLALKRSYLWFVMASVPYIFGIFHLHIHSAKMAKYPEDPIQVTLVQPSFRVEESLSFESHRELNQYALDEWRQLFFLLSEKVKQGTDLIVLPEFVVPFTAYSLVYEFDEAFHIIQSILGEEGEKALPPKKHPWAYFDGHSFRVNNAFFSQTLANFQQTGVVIGLEDMGEREDKRHFFSSAFYFLPGNQEPQSYDKRVLVPMGEYIPFSFLQAFAKEFGVFSSFTPGTQAKVFSGCRIPFSTSICYEETFGHLTRENRHMDARLLVNLTSDAWFPGSRLPKQHLDHAILRTTELGIPLVRSCNTGITCAIDSLGRIVAELGEGAPDQQTLSATMSTSVSAYTYTTLYSFWGDALIIVISLFAVCFEVFWAKRLYAPSKQIPDIDCSVDTAPIC